MTRPRILIIGVGNLLLEDEGFGVHVIRQMAEMSLPPQVAVIDGGTGGVDLLSYLEQADRVIFIDIILTQEPPGTIFKFTPEEVRSKRSSLTLSLHQAGLLEVINLAGTLSIRPQITIIATQPKRMDWGIGLSPELAARIPEVIQMALQEAEKS